jgi:hypothetical protein
MESCMLGRYDARHTIIMILLGFTMRATPYALLHLGMFGCPCRVEEEATTRGDVEIVPYLLSDAYQSPVFPSGHHDGGGEMEAEGRPPGQLGTTGVSSPIQHSRRPFRPPAVTGRFDCVAYQDARSPLEAMMEVWKSAWIAMALTWSFGGSSVLSRVFASHSHRNTIWSISPIARHEARPVQNCGR